MDNEISKNHTVFSNEKFENICLRIATSEDGLVKICKENKVNPVRFYEWIAKDENLRNKYARARDLQADFLADQIIEIADDKSEDEISTEKGIIENKEFVNRSRLKIDARKWIASKLKPKKYGDRLDVTTDGEKLTHPPAINLSIDGKDIKLT